MGKRKFDKRKEWLQRLTDATNGLDVEQIEKVISYCRFVVIHDVNGKFDGIFSRGNKYKTICKE